MSKIFTWVGERRFESVGKLRDWIWLKHPCTFQAEWLCLPLVKNMIKCLKDGLMSRYDTWLFSVYFFSWRWLLSNLSLKSSQVMNFLSTFMFENMCSFMLYLNICSAFYIFWPSTHCFPVFYLWIREKVKSMRKDSFVCFFLLWPETIVLIGNAPKVFM